MQKRLYFPAIDGLRLLAFIFVFFRHFKPVIPSRFLYDYGWIGVELFFLISAFLLTSLLKEEYTQQGLIHTRHFYTRRILRIWPLYFFYLAVVSFYAINFVARPFAVDRLAGNIFFYDNFLTAFQYYNKNYFTIHLWSISMEEQYYLLLPFAIPWLLKQERKKILRVFFIIFLVMAGGRLLSVMFNRPHTFIYVLPLSGDCFLAGVLLGLGVFDKITTKINSLLAFGGAALLLFSLYLIIPRPPGGYSQVYIYIIIALAFSLLLISVINKPHKTLLILFTNKPVRYLGKISFGLYIYHIITIYGARSLCYRLHLDIEKYHLPLSVLITILAAVLSYEFFEKFFLRYKKKYTLVTNRDP